MLRRWRCRPLIWSPFVAVGVQLILAAAVAAVTGGGDWPLRG